jgi:hypothetical protein
MTNSVPVGTQYHLNKQLSSQHSLYVYLDSASGFGLELNPYPDLPYHLIFFRTMKFLEFRNPNLHSDPDSAKSPGSVSGIRKYGYEGLIQTLFSSTQSINST